MKTVAIIPARRNSVRIPGKNWKMFHGRPIIEYSIEAAQRSRLFDEIWVSTDGEEIAQIAKAVGAQIFERKEDDGARGTQEVAAEVLADARLFKASIACVIYPTAPMLETSDLWCGWQRMHECDRTYSMLTDEIGSDIGWAYWGPATAFGIVPLGVVDPKKPMDGPACVGISSDRAIDINTPEDWDKAEQMYAAWMGL